MTENPTMTCHMQESEIKPKISSNTNLMLKTSYQVNHHGETIHHYVEGMHIGEQETRVKKKSKRTDVCKANTI